jgi:hypothetical protein
MDAEKSGIRIKPVKLHQDQKRWDQEKDPYWKHQQTVGRSGASHDGGTFRRQHGALVLYPRLSGERRV